MKKLITYGFQWIHFRLICYLKPFRPDNIRIDGPIKLDLKSIVFIDKKSKVHFGSNVRMKGTILKITDSDVFIGENGTLRNARVAFNESNVKIESSCIINDVMVNVNSRSCFKAGKHLCLTRQGNYKNGFFCNNATVELGDNVNIRAEIVCNKSVFQTGSNVFLNEGTQVRCTNQIVIGSNILFSYECILFDTNTHSLDPKDRLQEMIDGYPNEAVQSEFIKSKVKSAPVSIGNDVWVGTRSIILKGTVLGNEVIVGAATVLSGQKIEDRKVVYGNPAQWR